ncbi:MAG: hypothetical protein WC845_01390 [Candidatus Staskawiczbacteria bacterium]|jgi:hypothetical protein
MAAQRHQILEGPGKWDFVIGTFEAGKRVFFTVLGVPGVTKIRVAIRGVEMEDGTREKWLFKGILEEPDTFLSGSHPCNGYYDLRTRKGWVDLPT